LFLIRSLIWIGVLFMVVAGAVAGVRAVGQTAPLTPTYLQTGACEQPCWQGLRPGMDYIDHVMDQASRGSPYSARTTDYGDGIAQSFELSTYGVLTLADVIHEFGPPERVSCLGTDHSSLFPGEPWVMSAQLYFAGGLVVVDVVRPDTYTRLTPDMRVRAVQYFAPGDPVYPIGQTTAWYGFASTHRRYRDCHP